MTLFRGIELPSDEPVQYVGVHPMAWHRHPDQPTIGFIPEEPKEVVLGKIEIFLLAPDKDDEGWCVQGEFHGSYDLMDIFERAFGALEEPKLVSAAIFDGMLIFRLEEKEDEKTCRE